jgi:pyridoxamine 5'-phosphate oxidase-like protein
MNVRVRAVEAYLKALRTGEASATENAARYLAPDVELDTVGAHMWGNGHEEFKGYDETLKMISGIGVMTGVYRTAPWSNPTSADDGSIKLTADMGGGLVSSSTLTFSFNHKDQIKHIEQVNKGGTPAPVTDRIPEFVKGIVNSALANNTPMIVAYTDEQGAPNLSLRGSTQVFSDNQLSIWVRHANGGMANALKKNPRMALMYRDPPARTNLTFEGRAHFETDEGVRNRVFDLVPEVEQKHDPGRIGAALIIDVDRLGGNTPRGGVRMVRPS